MVAGKTSYLNQYLFYIRFAIYFAIWSGVSLWYRARSKAQDTSGDPNETVRMQKWSAPAVLLVANRSMAAIPLGGFLLAYAPVAVTGLGIWWWSRLWFHPNGLRLSWRGIVLHVAR